MKERYRTLSAVILMLMRENNGVEEILLQKRKNTGYMDGHYDCAASRTCRKYGKYENGNAKRSKRRNLCRY